MCVCDSQTIIEKYESCIFLGGVYINDVCGWDADCLTKHTACMVNSTTTPEIYTCRCSAGYLQRNESCLPGTVFYVFVLYLYNEKKESGVKTVRGTKCFCSITVRAENHWQA